MGATLTGRVVPLRGVDLLIERLLAVRRVCLKPPVAFRLGPAPCVSWTESSNVR
jgi:hypothetical protein